MKANKVIPFHVLAAKMSMLDSIPKCIFELLYIAFIDELDICLLVNSK